MYNVSALWDSIMSDQNHWFETKVVIAGNTYGQDSIMEMSVELRMFAEQQPGVGGCLSGELTLRMLSPNAEVPRMALIEPYVRVTNGTQTAEWIPQGKFYIDTRETTNNDDNLPITTFRAYDAMLKSEGDFPDTTDEFPMEDIDVVELIAGELGVGIDDRTRDLMTGAYGIGLPVGYSMREVLSNIAAMYAGNWIMNYDGDLLLVAVNGIPAETNYLINELYEPITFGQASAQHSLSGSVVSFSDGNGSDFDALSVEINPVQNLNGYDKPWPAGGGKNLFNADTGANGYIDNNGAVVSRSYQFASDYIAVTAGSSYTISAASQMGNIGIAYFDSNKAIILPRVDNASRQTLTITPASGVGYVRFWFYVNSSTNLNPTNVKETYKVQFESGSTATAYVPYSNICPISGWTEAKVTRTGKNILPPGTSGTQQGATYTVNPDGTITVTGTATGSSKRILNSALLKGGTQYVLSGCPIGGGQGKFGLALYETGTNTILGTDFGSGVTYTPVSDEIIDVGIRYWYGQSPAGTWKPQLEIGSSPTTYEPFSGNTCTIDLNGTRYGGTLDVLTGVLTVDRANIASYNGETLPGEWISSMDVYAPGTTPTTGAQVVYELASSQTVQLTAQQVQTLIYNNNVFADTGNVSLTYTSGGEVTRILV